MSDLISRADAIDAIFEAFSTGDEDADRYIAEKILADVPSAQSEQAVKDCRNCKHGKYNDHLETHFCYNPNECTEWELWEPIAQPEIIRCKDCVFTDGYEPIADGRYWCMLHGAYMHYCSDAERRTDETD